MNVLVVEDNKAVSLIICRIIEELGHEYVLAADGEAALRLYRQRNVDLLILDVELPILDGFSVAREIRNQNGQTPILFISGNHSEAYQQQCLDAGGETLMPKPLRPSELRRWLEVAFTQLACSKLTPSGASA
ncbi:MULTISPECIES: response regulator [Alcanivorax]|jgi:DNA-binding response OmpR family regulator|uniref:response regulator n=1 Tax=Alcanivorax TaxID=59753 RepID=UPI002351FE05|nr:MULTISPECIES: response regulator [Alcanivorax]|tara:strand:+ start:170 stop:565 length:396 start_codon:yes stop_codon:yes gene_type:complete